MSTLTDEFHETAKRMVLEATEEHFKNSMGKDVLGSMLKMLDVSMDMYRRTMDALLEEELKYEKVHKMDSRKGR